MKKLKIRIFLVIVFSALASAAALACVLLFAFLHPRSFTEAYLKHVFNRPVTVEELVIQYHPFRIGADNIHIANAGWGSAPDMVEIAHISAEPDMHAILRGKLKFNTLSVSGAKILLERNEQGVGNWKKYNHASLPKPAAVEAARSRQHFPTILNLQLQDSTILFRTSSGQMLNILFKDLSLQAADEDSPVTITADGAYNHIPVQVEVTAESYKVLHDTHKPLGMDIAAKGASALLSGHIQSMDPLNFDQFTGNLHADVKNIGEATSLLGAKFTWKTPVKLDADFEHKLDQWVLSKAEGNVASNNYGNSHVQFTEGARGQPDNLKTSLHFDRIDIASMLPPPEKKSGKNQLQTMRLDLSSKPPVFVDASLSANQLVYRKAKASNFKIHATIASGEEGIDDVSMDTFGGSFHASLSAKAEGDSNRINGNAALSNIDMEQLVNVLGAGGDIVKSRANASLRATAKGNSMEDWLASMQGVVSLHMSNGQLSRHLIRAASVDLRTPFTDKNILIPMPCMVAALKVSEGIGILSPFEVQTSEGTLFGSGKIDMPKETFDLVFRTDHTTTSVAALDIPIHVVGTFADPQVATSGSATLTRNSQAECDAHPQ